MKDLPEPSAILKVLKQLYPKGAGLHEPFFAGNEVAYLKECIDTRWVSYVGKFVERFESQLREFTGVPYVAATACGTSALHVTLYALGIRSGDEVLVPSLTFAATAHAVAYLGAIPHFVDSDPASLGMDPAKLAVYLGDIAQAQGDHFVNRHTGRRLAAMIPVHVFGHPADLDPLLELSARYRIPLIEDAAESLGSYYRTRHTGGQGIAAVLSFNGNKVVTTGGGGAVLTRSPELAARIRHLTTTAKVKHPWRFEHDEVGFNYRLPNLNAAVGCAQLEQLPGFLEKKRRLAERYQVAFQGVPGVKMLQEPSYAKSNYWLNSLVLAEGTPMSLRDEILDLTNAQGIGTRPAWTLLNRLPYFRESPKMDLSQAEELERRLICLPSSVYL